MKPITNIAALGLLIGGMPWLAHAGGLRPVQEIPQHVPLLVAEKEDLPLSKEDLFGISDTAPSPAPSSNESALPASKQALFGDEATALPDENPSLPIDGYVEGTLARIYASPAHGSEILGRLQLSSHGRLGQGVNWRVTGRAEYNAIYDHSDFYAGMVAHDQRARFDLGETYLDFRSVGLDWRVGRQQIVWGEMVGLFFADVVSAKNLNEFILPDFSVLRIPQWAARAEYFKDDFHAEAIWIPAPSCDLIGTPYDPGHSGSGSDFYPYPISPAGLPIIMPEDKPDNRLAHMNYGLRVSQYTNGWDLSGFWYSSMDSQPTFYRDPANPQVFYPRHDRIWQAGGTLSKDLGTFLLKAEAVYTHGRQFNETDLTPGDGLVGQNTFDWVVGLDFNPTQDTRLNTQLFQRVFVNHADNTLFDKYESGLSLLVSHKLPANVEAKALLIHSLNRNDWMLRPEISWKFKPDWRLSAGVDIFHGPQTGFFGQYDAKDRIYTQIRRDF